MAGRQKKPKDRLASRRDWYWTKSISAPTAVERLGAACDYLKVALAQRPGEDASDAATAAATHMFQLADNLMGVKP